MTLRIERSRTAHAFVAATLRAFAALLLLLASLTGARAADPSALWRIVHGQCVPDERQHRDPAPCALVDLAGGEARGYAVLKDLVGATQFLVLPTRRLPGIESPALLAPGAPNYFADAWAARRFVRAKAPAPLARDDLGLAINSVTGRTQDQLHIHVDCLKPEVRDALLRERDKVGAAWAPFPAALAGHAYIARRVRSRALAGVNPFRLLAAAPGAPGHMGEYTLLVAGARFGKEPGFLLLAHRADPAHGDPGSSEELQDHGCALARPAAAQ